MATFVFKIFTIFIILGVTGLQAQTQPAEFAVQQLGNIGTALIKLLNPLEATREAVQAAEAIVGMRIPEVYKPSYSENAKEVSVTDSNTRTEEGEDYGIDVLCSGNGKKHASDCRGEDWDAESEKAFSHNMMDLDLLTHDLGGVVPSGVKWAPHSEHYSYSTTPGSVHIAANPASLISGLPSLGGLAPSLASGIAGGTAAGVAAAIALPIGLLTLKIAKPFAWKLAIAAKIAFLKLVFLKKLVLIKGKVGALLLAKSAFLGIPLMLIPLLKGLGFFKFIGIALIGALKSLDCMFLHFGQCHHSASPNESLMLHILPWFAKNREFSGDAKDILKMPSDFLESLIEDPSAFGPDFLRNFPQLGFAPDALAEFAQLFTGNVGSVASLLKPSFRRLQDLPSDEIAKVQDLVESVMNDLMGGFSSALQGYENVRNEYEQFIVFANQQNPKLLEKNMKQEMMYRLNVPQSTSSVININETVYASEEAMAGQRSVNGEMAPSADDIDSAFRGLSDSIQGRFQMRSEEK